MPEPRWFSRPGVILAGVVALVMITVLFIRTPTSGRDGDQRLTTTSTDPLGAKLYYDLAGKLGYTVSRANRWSRPTDPRTILAVFNPATPLLAAEVHDMLEHARSGGALLVVLGAQSKALSDSLHISVDEVGGAVRRSGRSAGCTRDATQLIQAGLWPLAPSLFGLKIADSLRAGMETFTTIDQRRRESPDTLVQAEAMIGIPYGAGRIVVASDPDAFANDALRNCNYGLDLLAVAALRYLADGDGKDRTRIVFDEYHQRKTFAFSSQGIIGRYLTGTKSGNTLLQVCLAGLVLLLAAAPRILPPRNDQVIERRSPLEHVDALARAYAQVGATRTGTQRLVRGLQRRLGGAKRTTTRVDDEAFLLRIAESLPKSKPDVDAVRHALGQSVTSKEFVEVGNAISRIEAALTRT